MPFSLRASRLCDDKERINFPFNLSFCGLFTSETTLSILRSCFSAEASISMKHHTNYSFSIKQLSAAQIYSLRIILLVECLDPFSLICKVIKWLWNSCVPAKLKWDFLCTQKTRQNPAVCKSLPKTLLLQRGSIKNEVFITSSHNFRYCIPF